MSMQRRDDPIWQTAWQWVLREHEEQPLPPQAQAELREWLGADPAHRQCHEQAAHLWLLTGLVPPVNHVPAPDDAS